MFGERGFEAGSVADIVTAASVSVQTSFNHFSSKESLFFDEHVSWLGELDEAVRCGPPDVSALTRLQEHLTATTQDAMRFEAAREGRRFVAILLACPALPGWTGRASSAGLGVPARGASVSL